LDDPELRGYMAKDWCSTSRHAWAGNADGQAIRSQAWYESKAAGGAGAGGEQETF
jgi:hypothetical protein